MLFFFSLTIQRSVRLRDKLAMLDQPRDGFSFYRVDGDGGGAAWIAKLKSWLEGGGKSPNEQALKSRLRDLL